MNAIYEFVTGPLAWLAWTAFIVGSAWRLASMYKLAKTKDASSIAFMSWKYSLRSIAHWITPFATLGWRKNPALTVATFLFHILLFAVPIFVTAHVMLWDQFFGISFPAIPDPIGDYLTIVVVVLCLYFAYRRIQDPNVRYITKPADWLALAIVFAPFLTGFLAFRQIFPYDVMVILHIVAGEIMLVAIPWTRLSHMIFAVFTRSYMGSEFGGVRHARDW
jgi:nitrate reductase gamma subunit